MTAREGLCTVAPCRRRLAAAALSLALLMLLGACAQVPDALNPVEWYKGARDWVAGEKENPDAAKGADKPLPGADAPYPQLSSVPPRPDAATSAAVRRSAAEERRRAAESLAADRDRARYTDEVIRRQTDPAREPPPRVAAAAPEPVVPSAPSVPRAPEPPPMTATPPAVAAVPERAPMPPAPEPMPPSPEPAPAAAPPPARVPAPPVRRMPSPPPAREPPLADAPRIAVPPPPELSSPIPAPQPAPRPEPAPRPTTEFSQLTFGPPPADIAPFGSRTTAPPPVSSLPSGPQTFRVARAAPAGRIPTGLNPFDNSSVLATIRFTMGSARLGPRARQAIRSAYQAYRSQGGVLRVIGHASSRTRNMDPVRHQMVNFNVSLDRANAVARELIRLGARPEAVLVDAVSDTRPRYLEVMPAGEAANRRAEIRLER